MHPIFRSKASFLLYFAAWIPLAVMFALVLTISAGFTGQQSGMLAAPLTFILAFLCLSPWYACRAMPIGVTPVWKLTLNHVLSAVMASSFLLLVAWGLVVAYSRMFPDLSGKFSPATPLLGAAGVLIYVLSIAFHYAMLAIESSRKAEVLAREAELRALKAQVNPHFLFNSLNSISALTTLDPAKARDMCIRLSDFLRMSLGLGERASITFGQEIELTRTYLDVEQVRFGTRLRVLETIEAACSDCNVPPLLVQPLVENAIKHGIATLVEGGEICISAKLAGGGMQFAIENPFDPEAPLTRQSGIGLRNVRDRLQQRYGGAASLKIDIGENRYRVSLFFPCGAVSFPCESVKA